MVFSSAYAEFFIVKVEKVYYTIIERNKSMKFLYGLIIAIIFAIIILDIKTW